LIKATYTTEKIVPIKHRFANVIVQQRVVENCHTPENFMGIWAPNSLFCYLGVRILDLSGFGDPVGLKACPFVSFRMKGTVREHLKPGMTVKIVLKKDQRTGTLTEGVIKAILTKSPQHPHGIKVLLENGSVGRVKEIIV